MPVLPVHPPAAVPGTGGGRRGTGGAGRRWDGTTPRRSRGARRDGRSRRHRAGACRRAGDFRQRPATATGWSRAGARCRPGFTYHDGAAVCVDSKDNVYVFNRGAHPVIVFDRDGKFLRSWGEDIGFVNAHGAAIGPDDMLYLTDDFGAGGAQVHAGGQGGDDHRHAGQARTRVSPAIRSTAARTRRSRRRATSTSPTATRTRACTNTRPDGKLLLSWGEPGTGAGPVQPGAQHRLRRRRAGSMSPTARTIACRCSTATASTRTQWNNLMRPCGLYCRRAARSRSP